MSLHADLLRQGPGSLPSRNPGGPLQASLRRAISASYYALFHLLVDEATKRMFPGGDRAALRGCLARAFLHGDMKKVAQQFSEGGVSPKLSPGMNGQAVQPELIGVAATFVDLQQGPATKPTTTRRDDSRGGMSSTWWTVRSRHSAIGPRYEGAFRRMRFSRDCSRSATCASEERSNPTTPGGRDGGGGRLRAGTAATAGGR